MDALAPDAQPVGINGCDTVMSSILEPFDKVVHGTDMCMNVYDIRLMDTAPSCGMNWPPDLKQVTPWLRVRLSTSHVIVSDLFSTATSGGTSPPRNTQRHGLDRMFRSSGRGDEQCSFSSLDYAPPWYCREDPRVDLCG